jgi:hypothetical protein
MGGTMKAKHAIKRLYSLYKESDEDIELQIKMKDDNLVGEIHLPVTVKDIKIETLEGDEKVIIIDLS